jgi:hypothetical protein
MNKINISLFLKTISEFRSSEESMGSFVQNIFSPIIDTFLVKDRFGNDYYFSDEYVSRLKKGKVELTLPLKAAVKKADGKKEKFQDKLYSAIVDFVSEVNLHELQISFEKSLNDDIIDKTIKESIEMDFQEGRFECGIWKLFVIACLEKNIDNKAKSLGRKRKSPTSFFYLSEEGKNKRACYFISYLKNENNHLTSSDLTEFINILAYWPEKISERDKKKITSNFIRTMKAQDRCSTVRYFTEVVEDSEETFGNEVAKRFKHLREYGALAFSKIKIESLCKLINVRTTTPRNFRKAYELIQEMTSELQFADINYLKYLIKKEKFIMPDLTGQISFEEWQYCLAMANFIKKLSFQKEFKDYLGSITIRPNNRGTIKERIKELLFQSGNY